MTLARVVGTVTSTIKHPAYNGRALMVLQCIDANGNDTGDEILAIDTVQAGVGDTVLALREGSGVRQILKGSAPPIRSLIVGIVDQVETA